MYKPATIMATTKRIDAVRGQRNLSSFLTSGYITKASSTATVKGKITEEVSRNTAPAMIQQIKTIKKKMARLGLKGLEDSPILLLFCIEGI
jgi:hypothetical protein